MIDYQPLIRRWRDTGLAPWAQLLPDQIARGLALERYGDLPRWLQALEALPDIAPAQIHLDRARVGADCSPPLDPDARAALRDSLQLLHPWRKGPFELFGVHIDTEWRSDWKWDRLQPHIDPLARPARTRRRLRQRLSLLAHGRGRRRGGHRHRPHTAVRAPVLGPAEIPATARRVGAATGHPSMCHRNSPPSTACFPWAFSTIAGRRWITCRS